MKILLALSLLFAAGCLSACESSARSEHPIDKSVTIDQHDFRFGGHVQTGGSVKTK